jgi:hypothetical protein
MKQFSEFKEAIQLGFIGMSGNSLFVTDTNKDDIWEKYLDSFPEGTNEKYRERREYDCQCCKQFIRLAGSIVSIVNNKLVSIWDIEIGGHFQVVADVMSAYVKSFPIKYVFLHYENRAGTDFNHQQVGEDVVKWQHFYLQLPGSVTKPKDDIPSIKSEMQMNREVFQRGVKEISLEAAETVLELIQQKSIYRGEENKPAIEYFIEYKKEFDEVDLNDRDNFYWARSSKIGFASRVRSTAIGTLLVDISNEIPLDDAVRMFESKVAPSNYKRPTALITKGMIDKAQKTVIELGYGSSLSRRYAVATDVTINNVLFADKSVKPLMNVFDELAAETTVTLKNFDKVEEVNIEDFITNIIPQAVSLEFIMENRHTNNLMSLIAPVDLDAKGMFKWGNNFSWTYNGEVADSMKERVKRAGGNIEGVLRYSIMWNEDGQDHSIDFDAHCIEPNGLLIHYPLKREIQLSSGMLDVDIQRPGEEIAVENIVYTDLSKMPPGEYQFVLHNYSSSRSKGGFSAEIEFDGKRHSYVYPKVLKGHEKVSVATVHKSVDDTLSITKSLESTQSSKEIWGVTTHSLRKAIMVMNSPNHWDGEKTGNKHYFFILEGCRNNEKARGFYNEFLDEKLNEHRKVFEILGSKMKTELSDDQLSGLGFSSTQRNSILCKVSGNFSRTIKINF